MIKKTLLWAVIALVSSCFNPSYPEGLGCDVDGWCPPGLVCNRAAVCVAADGDGGAGGGDALVGMGALVSISIGDDRTIETGATYQFTITGTYQDDSEVVIDELAIWRSTDNGIVWLDFNG
ncbi:MAG: hypothetical protein GY773_34620, partial [Actinomycetia bacterium]|nr:hypothetical protein [Actinomycetes bacterium]